MKNSLIFLILLAASLWLLNGCEPRNHDPYEQRYVLQGQMYIGLPPEIRITHTVPIEQAYSSADVGVSGAVVDLKAGSRTLRLVETTNDPRGHGYYTLAAGDTHTVAPGLNYEIHAAIGSDSITARTTAAGILHITEQNKTVVEYGDEELVLRWPIDSLAAGYYLILENLNEHCPDESVRVSGNNGPSGFDGRHGYWNISHRQDSVRVPWIILNCKGVHRVRVLSCDRALWDYSYTWLPGDAENQPVSNVNGALGIFTAGGADTVYFTLTDSISDGPIGEE